MNSKTETYIGFAVKKGAVVYGVDEIVRYRKKMYLVIYTDELAKRSLDNLHNGTVSANVPLIKINDVAVMKNKNCKALAICDKSLADAIVKVSTTSSLEETNG